MDRGLVESQSAPDPRARGFVACGPSPAARGPLGEEVGLTRRYFASFADDYQRAFAGKGRRPLHWLINVLFRQRTFLSRTEVVRGFLERHGIADKRVLDLGCGTGEVSLLAAEMGAKVTGLDVTPEMIAIAREQAERASLGGAVHFEVADVMSAPLTPADVTLVISVLEYYSDIESLLRRVSAATGELLVVVDTRGPWWRRALRHALAFLKGFRVHYRRPEDFARVVEREGLVETARVRGHSFWALAYRRERS